LLLFRVHSLVEWEGLELYYWLSLPYLFPFVEELRKDCSMKFY
jgi:hypothetical protein